MFMPAAGGRRRVLPSSRKCYESELRTEKRIMILSHPLCVETETRSTIRLIYILDEGGKKFWRDGCIGEEKEESWRKKKNIFH